MTDTGLRHLPGVATVSEVEVLTLLEAGYTDMKFFPAEAVGGTKFLASLHSPAPAARFCPTGGITPDTAADYLKLQNVGCVGGSWLTPPAALGAGRWGSILKKARATVGLRYP